MANSRLRQVILLLGSISFLAVVVFASYAFVFLRDQNSYDVRHMFMFDDPSGTSSATPPWPSIVSSAVALLAGILFGTVYSKLGEKATPESSQWKTVLDAVKSRGFTRGVFASPIVFGGVYVGLKGQPDGVLAVIFAFQNGFFWEAILKGKPEKQSASSLTMPP